MLIFWMNLCFFFDANPRYSSRLADRIEALGGLRWMLLTHMDDVADHEAWAERFPGVERVMHAADVRGAERWPYVIRSRSSLSLCLFLPLSAYFRASFCDSVMNLCLRRAPLARA